jgi:metallo-beta-lactamase class B
MRHKIPALLVCLLIATAVHAQDNETWRSWNQPIEPFRILGNLYYVGASDIASYLVTTPEGHILVDGGFPETAAMIERNVEALGFDLDDVKILLNTHAHFDHAGGLARLKERTGAQFMAMAQDAEWLRTGDAGFGSFPPVAVDRELRRGDEVKLGGVRMVAQHTPGHTPGCTTWTFQVRENGVTYKVIIVGSPNALPEHQLVGNAEYPNIVKDFEGTFLVLKGLNIDVFLGAHGSYFGLNKKRELLAAGGDGTVFVDPEGYAAFVERKEKQFREELARQRAGAESQSGTSTQAVRFGG